MPTLEKHQNNEPLPSGIKNALLIFNPQAGRSNSARKGQIDRARQILSRAGIATELAHTIGPWDAPGGAAHLAREAVAHGAEMVIACGGDGTLNEVVNGLAGSQVPLALLPAGTANILAKELGLPWNIEKAAALIAGSHLQRIALGCMTADHGDFPMRYFLSVAGAGPDGAIVNAVHAGLKKSAGTLAYWAEGMRQVVSYAFPQFRVTSGDRIIDATLIVVGRTRHYGGPFRITTEAGLHKDEFELMVCTARGPLRYLSYLPILWAGRLRHARHAHFLKTTAVRVEPLHNADAYVQVDGEAAGRLPVEFRIVSDALTLVVPAAPQ